MLILLIDTVAATSCIQLYNNKKLASEFSWESGQRLGDDLLPNIIALLSRHHVTLADVRGILVNAGPGSFTGTRIGVAVANALAFAGGVPVQAVQGDIWSSVSGLTIEGNQYTGPVHPIYDRAASVTIKTQA